MKNIFIIAFCQLFVLGFAQVGINTDHPDPSAIVDLGPGNRGMLFPRVNLESNVDVTTVASPANGVLLYNTNANGTNVSANSYYFYNTEDSKWIRLVSESVANTIISEIKVPVYVGQINKLDTQTLNELDGSALNVVHFTSSESVFNSAIIEFLPGSDSTFLIKKSGNYAVEGFANLELTTTSTSFWTVAIQTGVSDDSDVTVPATFEYGMRCPYYKFESDQGFSSTCNFAGAIYLAQGTVVRLIAVRKNGTNATAGSIGGNGEYAASLKLVYFPI